MTPPAIYGIRHHGPGSARSLRRALEKQAPDCLLIEGPPEAEPLLPLAQHAGLRPPVALLLYRPDAPQHASFYPFARFSPEWQALRYGLRLQIPLRLIDLPHVHALALSEAQESVTDADAAPNGAPRDPLGQLAAAAGYADGNTWWERVVEQRRQDEGVFAAVLDAMAALRAAMADEWPLSPLEALREAAMRRAIRSAQQAGYQNIAVVCGAWHAPVLAQMPTSASEDNALLRGLPKVKVEATWVPWSYANMTLASGYGAGISSPRWYDHLWQHPVAPAQHWCIAVARLLRTEGYTASPAQVIDSVRLAEALAALRGQPSPGLDELLDAVQATLGEAGQVPLALIRQQLIVGELLGGVPHEAPAVPLQRDLTAQQKRLRLPVSETARQYDLDLRQPTDLARSRLFHRLALLEIRWAKPAGERRAKGTFHELWNVRWQATSAVDVVQASLFGATVAVAARARAIARAAEMPDLPALTELVRQVLLADLPEAVVPLAAKLQALAALTSDTALLMDALLPLARLLRYGDVRQTGAALVAPVLAGMAARINIGLSGACAALNDEAAQQMAERLQRVTGALTLLQADAADAEMKSGAADDLLVAWYAALAALLDRPTLPGVLAGRACRLLLDADRLPLGEATRRLGLALSVGSAPTAGAAWVEGFLHGSGLLLLHDDRLWQTLDGWLLTLPAAQFETVLPLLRRTFSRFSTAERVQLGQRARRGHTPAASGLHGEDAVVLDPALVAEALAIAAALLGLGEEANDEPTTTN